MITVRKTGFWIFGRTLVTTSDGKTHAYSKQAVVKPNTRGVCNTDPAPRSKETVCFVDSPAPVADRRLADNAKSVTVTTRDGQATKHKSAGFSPTRAERRGDDVLVVEQGGSGSKVVARYDAGRVASVQANGCSICEQLNPRFARNDAPRFPRKS